MSDLILGNSHMACIKQACEDVGAKDIFFAGGSAGYGDFFKILDFDFENKTIGVGGDAPPVQRKLWELTTGTSEALALTRFRRIFVVGLINGPNPWNLNNCPGNPDFDLGFLDTPPMSFSLYRDTWADLYLKKAVEFERQLKRISKALNVTFIPRPFIREDAVISSPRHAVPRSWNQLSDEQKRLVTENERELYRALCKRSHLNVFIPGDEFVTDGYRCPAEFSQGALGSRNFDPQLAANCDDSSITRENLTHKNKAYGKLVLERVLFAESVPNSSLENGGE